MEDPTFIQQCDMNSLDQFTTQQIAAALGEEFQNSFSSDSSYPHITPRGNNTITCSSMEASQQGGTADRPMKQLRTNSWNSCTTDHVSTPDASPPNLLSFGNQSSPTNHQQFYSNLIAGAAAKPKDESSLSPRTSTMPTDILISQGSFLNQGYMNKAGQVAKRPNMATTRPPSHTQDHIIAERKRREKLSQRFIALSAIVPGLKKVIFSSSSPLST